MSHARSDLGHGASRNGRFENEAMPFMGNLLRAALRLTPSRETAEALVQETMLRAWLALDQCESRANCKAWLFGIMLQRLGQQRETARMRPVAMSLEEPEPLDELPAPAGSASFGGTNILTAIDALPLEHRAVLILAVVEGFDCQQIAGLQAIPVATVRARLSHALSNLRLLLTQPASRPVAPAGRSTCSFNV